MGRGAAVSGTDYTLTPNYGFTKPVPGADDDVWGAHINANSDLLDLRLKSVSDAQGNYLPLSGGTMTGPIAIAGGSNPFTVTNTVGQVPATNLGGSNLVVFSTIGGNNRIVLDAINGNPMFTGRHASGTAAAPGATELDRTIAGLQGFGRGATGYVAALRASVELKAAEAFTDTAAGTYIRFATAPIGSVAAAIERMRITDAGLLLIGSGAQNPITFTPGATVSNDAVISTSGTGFGFSGLRFVAPQLYLSGPTVIYNSSGADTTVPLAFTSGAQIINILSGPTVLLDSYGGTPAEIRGRSTPGNVGALSPMQLDGSLLELNGTGSSGTGFQNAVRAAIRFKAAANWNAIINSTYIQFLTSTNSTFSEKMRLTNTGALLIGTTAPVGTEKLNVVGGAVIDTIRVTPTTAPLFITDGSTPPAPGTGVLLALVGAGATRLEVTAFGGLSTSFIGRSSGGTPAAQTPMAAGQVLSLFGAQGWNGAGFSASVQIQYVAAENYSATNSGSYMTFQTTAIGANARREVMRLTDAGALLIGTTVAAANAALQMQGADNLPTIAAIDAIGNAAAPIMLGRRAMGVAGARTALTVDEVLFSMQGAGYGQIGYSTPRALIEMRAAEAWNGAGQGTYMTFLVTSKGTNAPAEVMRIASDATVLIGKTVSAGLVSLEVAGGAIVDSMTLGADPVNPPDAATKRYVDARTALNVGRNFLHNGLFNVAQRGIGPFTAPGNYTADRWVTASSGGTLQVDLPAITVANAQFIGDEAAERQLTAQFAGSAAAGDYTALVQRMEDARRLSGKTVTVSFWAFCGSGALKLGVNVSQGFGSGGAPSAAVAVNGQAVTLGVAWARYSLTFAVPSVAGKTFGTTAGSDYTQFAFWFSCGATNAIAAGNPGVQTGAIALWGVQLEIGAVATPLEKPDPQQELAKCQRFFERIAFAGVNVTGYTSQASPPIVQAARLGFATVKRATPTVSGPAAGIGAFNVAGVVAITGSFTADPLGVDLNNFGSATGVVGGMWNAVPVGGNAGCYIDASADL